jgi:hypothetical protein
LRKERKNALQNAFFCWFKLSLLTCDIISAIKGSYLEGEERSARMKNFRLLVIYVAGRTNRNNCVMGLRLCNDAAALKRMQKVWTVFELPMQATLAKALGRRGGLALHREESSGLGLRRRNAIGKFIVAEMMDAHQPHSCIAPLC